MILTFFVVGMGVGVAIAVTVVMMILVGILYRRYRSQQSTTNQLLNDQDVNELL